MRRRKLWFLVLLFALSSSAQAQQVHPATDTNRWEARWSPAWDLGDWFPPGDLSLDLRAGHGVTRGQPAPGLVRHRKETYFLAQLRVPLELVAFSGARTKRRGQRERQKSRRELEDLGDSDHGKGSHLEHSGWASDGPLASRAAGTNASARGRPPAGGERVRQERAATLEEEAEEKRAEQEQAEEERGRPVAGSSWELPFPFVAEAIERALETRGLTLLNKRLDSLRRRSRLSGLLPELRVRGVQGADQTRSIDSAGVLPGDETTRDGLDSLLEVRLTFHLDRLVVGDDEAGIERMRQSVSDESQEVRADVVGLLLDWNQARVELARRDLHDDERLKARLRATRAATQLGVLTGGWFQGERTFRRFVREPGGRGERKRSESSSARVGAEDR